MATKLILNQWGRPAHSMHVLPLLGIAAGGHLPKEGMPRVKCRASPSGWCRPSPRS